MTNSLVKYIQSSIPSFNFYTSVFNNSYSNNLFHIYLLSDKLYLKKVISFLFLDINIQAKLLSDIVGSDFPSKLDRFNVIYNILSLQYNHRFFLSIWVNELEKVSSIISLHPSASWYEREIWDLYGIHFDGNDDLRRILTDYGFLGHPLRKDFPLSGFTELYYNSRVDSIIHQPISLIQEYRQFDTLSPWDWFQKEKISK
jgi:NADH-quinone oxidoreductase subunit C